MKRSLVFALSAFITLFMLAFGLNPKWSLQTLAQSYSSSSSSSVVVPPPTVDGVFVGGNISLISSSGSTSTTQAYAGSAPEVIALFTDAGVPDFQIDNVDIPLDSSLIGTLVLETVINDNIVIRHYLINIIEGTHLFQVNIENNGVLLNDGLMYLVSPSNEITWFYQSR